jgi:hypothetical protein
MLQTLGAISLSTAQHDSSLQRRFWDESAHLTGLFETYRETNDCANAIPCFGRLARYRFAEVASRPAYNAAKKSIISVFQPKSGGTFLYNRLLELGYQEFSWLFTHRMCQSVCYASDEALGYYVRGGCASHVHARPDANILAALDRAQVKKIWVHLRNPAETAVSSYHHYLDDAGASEVDERKQRQLAIAAACQGLAPGVSKSNFVIKHIGWHIDWVTQWLRFAQDHAGLVEFSYYPEITDPRALLTRVFDRFGIDPPDEFSIAPTLNDRYRTKATTDWRHELTPESRAYLELRVRAELQLFPAFEQLWS